MCVNMTLKKDFAIKRLNKTFLNELVIDRMSLELKEHILIYIYFFNQMLAFFSVNFVDQSNKINYLGCMLLYIVFEKCFEKDLKLGKLCDLVSTQYSRFFSSFM